MKKTLYIFLFIPALLIGQLPNEWINYDQSYFKFPIAKDGVYRIDFQQLVNAGLNIGSLDPRNMQIFAKGVEQPIYIQGEFDGSFDLNDFIEFYGEKNDGWYDHVLFSDSAHVLNPFVSMYTDTLYYFLTWNSSVNNLRMEDELDLNFNSYTPKDYFWNESLWGEHYYDGSNNFYSGKTTPTNYPVPEYSNGEGRFLGTMPNQGKGKYPFDIPNVYQFGPDAKLVVEMIGAGAHEHSVDLYFNDSLIYRETFPDYKNEVVNIEIPNEWLIDFSQVKAESVTSAVDFNDKWGLSYVYLRYPQAFNMNGESNIKFCLPVGNESKDLLVMENYNNLNSTVRLYDVTNRKRIKVQPISGKFYALVPNNGEERKCYLTTESSIRNVSGILPVNKGSSKFINYEAEIIQKSGVDFILLSGGDLMEAAVEYGDYRESNGLKTLVVDMDQLYDQFSFGIRKHPMSIRSFSDAIINDWGFNPSYLFLCGKSISMNNWSARYGSQYEENIVPTWSVLGADVGFTAGLNLGSILDPAIATGRLSANNPSQVRAYLKKVKDYEAAPPADWMKQVLHFGGGSDESEQNIFKDYLENYKTIVEDSLFGGKVHTFLKNTSDPLQINLSDSVEVLINKGVSLMTFFGHAYGSNFDQSIDDPENYENTGRYPFILANSCLIGNIHTNGFSSGSERFVLAEDKGSIGFLGSSSLGVPEYLNKYSRDFYKNLSTDFYGWPVGKIVQETIKDMQDSSSILNRDVAMYMTLHCDPAIVLNSHEKPDYTVYGNDDLTQPNVYFSPDEINSEKDSFDLNIIIKNIGKVSPDTFAVSITRSFPNQGFPDTTYTVEVFGILYSETLKLRLPIDKVNGLGLNSFFIRLDSLNEIDELSKLNNTVEVQLFINSSDITPVFPYDFAIVPNAETVLKASTGNPYATPLKYYFQIDTSDAFTSPSMIEEVIISSGGVVEWDPTESLSLADFYSDFELNTLIETPQVFFWRVSSDSLSNNGFSWKSASFQHVTGKNGWGQSHFHQLKDDNYVFMDYDYDGRRLSFFKQTKNIKAVSLQSNAWSGLKDMRYEIDGAIQCYSAHANHKSAFLVTVIDKTTLEPWHTQEHGDYGHGNYDGGVPKDDEWEGINGKNFYFRNDNAVQIDSLISFVNDVPDSNYVLFYSLKGNNCSSWLTGQSISSAYENMYNKIGANVDSLKNYNVKSPYILFFQKGDTNSVVEAFSSDGIEDIDLNAKMENSWINGFVESSVIGPSTNWSSFHWELSPSENGNLNDSARISIYGMDFNGNETLIIDSLTGVGDLLNLSDSIDANVYPYLKLESFFADDLNRTPDKLVRWQVTFDEIPEAALNPLKVSGYTLIDSVQQGEDLLFITAVENISTIQMDSIQIRYKIIDHNFNNYPFTYTLNNSLAPGGVIYDTIIIPTTTLIANNTLWYEINPYTGPKPWQLEQYHFNNLYLHEFNVYGEKLNPILDVTFDGMHILNGDIVSPTSNIVITLDDENQYLILDDESLVQVFINYPTLNNQDSLLLLDPSEYIFTAANLPKNKCSIEFTSDFKTDGTYELRVMATDKSNNVSGEGDGVFDYRISFEIVTESSITQLINYPNPFSTSTKFVFTLTGTEVPDNMLIQIMTITGKVVKEITQEELGPINIGRNITEYEWDGTDKYGDKLANGVYLYKVQVQMDGSELKERGVTISTSEGTSSLSDKYFKKGLGKMYILR